MNFMLIGILGLDEYVNVKSNMPTIVQYDFILFAYKRNHVLLEYVFIIFKCPLKRHLQSCQISNVHWKDTFKLDIFAQSCQHEKGELKQVTRLATYSPFVWWWTAFHYNTLIPTHHEVQPIFLKFIRPKFPWYVARSTFSHPRIWDHCFPSGIVRGNLLITNE